MDAMLSCIYPEAASDDSDSEDEGVCVGCVCEGVAILDEGIEEAARRPDAAEPKELTAWSRARLNKLKRHRAEARKQRSILLRFREKTRKPSRPHSMRYEEAVQNAWRALSLAVWKSNFGRCCRPSTRRCPSDSVGSMAWRPTKAHAIFLRMT